MCGRVPQVANATRADVEAGEVVAVVPRIKELFLACGGSPDNSYYQQHKWSHLGTQVAAALGPGFAVANKKQRVLLHHTDRAVDALVGKADEAKQQQQPQQTTQSIATTAPPVQAVQPPSTSSVQTLRDRMCIELHSLMVKRHQDGHLSMPKPWGVEATSEERVARVLGPEIQRAFHLMATGGKNKRPAATQAGDAAAQVLLHVAKYGRSGPAFTDACPPPAPLETSHLARVFSGNGLLQTALSRRSFSLPAAEIRSNCRDHSALGAVGVSYGGLPLTPSQSSLLS